MPGKIHSRETQIGRKATKPTASAIATWRPRSIGRTRATAPARGRAPARARSGSRRDEALPPRAARPYASRVGVAAGALRAALALTRERRPPVDPVHLEVDARVVKGFEVRHLLACLRVDHVTRVADVDEAPVRAVLEGPDARARGGARVLVAGERLREPDVLDPPRSPLWKSAEVEDVNRAVRRVEDPELRPVGSERKTVARRVRPEPPVPGEALETDDVELLGGAQVEHAKAEQIALRDVHDSVLLVRRRQDVRRERCEAPAAQASAAQVQREDA